MRSTTSASATWPRLIRSGRTGLPMTRSSHASKSRVTASTMRSTASGTSWTQESGRRSSCTHRVRVLVCSAT